MRGREVSEFTCLTYCAIPYNGRGWTETCANLLMNFPSAGITPTLLLPRFTKPLPPSVNALESLPFPLSKLPWQIVSNIGLKKLNSLFRRQILMAAPETTIVYFWPGTPLALVEETRKAGILTVRQMINVFQGTAKALLDRAYSDLSLPDGCSITEHAISCEIEELGLYDYVLAPNPEVDRSLQVAGVPTARIVPSSFGWSPARFNSKPRIREESRPLRFLFVGIACVRKGIPTLLDAWKNAGVSGELVIVGSVEPAIQDRLNAATREGSVRHVAFTDDLEQFYHNSDVFVFPTFEEGGPQVTLEAGGCGLPVITTAMGAARLVQHEVNGLIVEAGRVDDLAAAIQRITNSATLRSEFSTQIRQDAELFTYDKVSRSLGATMVELLRARPFAGNKSAVSL
ncbi:glycosyltransferase [Sinorhizobium meliloti]|uniref:glycosyltransferase n=1 Tax=Rhizobium meliloti TaxID=382 RepID=UPI000FDA9545|nr:glycosyltransferase [Sinorhizobium meliloti]MDX0011487.1 glycosyltransferase [Sinorhizobium meliloti]MDX0303462.1 glycosyltransferase [Sinorhizobium meliloti]RVG77897.1 glycosyltransferase [Sinorhizobium meliloti]